MPDYQKMYKTLFNEVSNTIERLQIIQQEVEELYISAEEPLWLEDYPKEEMKK